MIAESEIAHLLPPDAKQIHSFYQAADQDGYDGGWIRFDHETGAEQWVETLEELKGEHDEH